MTQSKHVLKHNARAWDARARGGERFTRPATEEQFRNPLAALDSNGWLGENIRDKHMLCLGAGGGKASALFATAGAIVTVVDISPEMLAIDRKVAAERGLEVTTVEASIDDLSALPEARFEIVSQPVSSCYVPDVKAVYREVARVIVDGGLYVSQHKQPVSMQAVPRPGANGFEVSEPYYREGPLPEVKGSLHRESGMLEFLHRWEDLLGGLCREGFVIEDLVEPVHADPLAEKDSFAYRSCFIPPYVRIKARRRPRADVSVAERPSEDRASMKLVAIESYPVRIPLKPERRMSSSLGQHTVSEYLLVRVLTDAGIEGAGEATVMPRWSGETVHSAQALVDHLLAPALVGCDPHDVAEIDRRMDQLCKHNWFAKSALEMACWDIQGKAAGVPVYELLGGAKRSRDIRCRFSVGAYDEPRLRRVVAERVEAGFTTIKVKVGGTADDDLHRVRAARDVMGPELELVIDANCGWEVDTAIAKINALEECRIGLVEQPTPDGDYAALARVRRETGLPVMADDICFDLVHAAELIRNECCDVISVYPGKNGGLRKSMQIVELAAGAGVPCSIGSNLELDIATAAMGHLVLACENMQIERFPGDMLGPVYHEFAVVKDPLRIEGPIVHMSDKPGLGVEVDWDVVRRSWD
ncbi:N-succinyl-L-Arg/Lys racemase (N-succinyl amino acid racemase) (NSAR) [Durusdinium trenchii]|uniref:N-succinyl-L-Arg/Lys racemase (N-succinyl amino acid racemase) (NSAR) n=2 Tax=Durusdinium trenchii TaxID=1381693 RepID=A0ABP0JV26_9DINO